jgi:hypothetical protein
MPRRTGWFTSFLSADIHGKIPQIIKNKSACLFCVDQHKQNICIAAYGALNTNTSSEPPVSPGVIIISPLRGSFSTNISLILNNLTYLLRIQLILQTGYGYKKNAAPKERNNYDPQWNWGLGQCKWIGEPRRRRYKKKFKPSAAADLNKNKPLRSYC